MIGIRLASPGAPVIFTQQRAGLYGKPFKIYKFRTMVPDAEDLLDKIKEEHGNENDGPAFKLERDPRIFPFGRFLRKFSIDEFPQMINVLKGEMSLVGPRPERPVFTKQFSEEYLEYMLRHKVKAGMTGWAQIHGMRGNTSLRRRLRYDLYYVRNWSLWLDVVILVRTFRVVFKGSGAY